MQTGIAVQYNGDLIAQTRAYKTVWCYAAVAVAENDVVELDHTGEPPGGGTNPGRMAVKIKAAASFLGFGSAVRAIAAGTWGEVVVLGEASVKTATTVAIAAGTRLVCHTDAGKLTDAASAIATAEPDDGTQHVVAIAMAAPAANVTVVQWINAYGY